LRIYGVFWGHDTWFVVGLIGMVSLEFVQSVPLLLTTYNYTW